MAGREDEPQQVVVERIVDRGSQVRVLVRAAPLDLARQLLRLAVVHAGTAQAIDRAVLGGRHEPGAGLSGTPDSGHCSSAATNASWARSSARPTSRTTRAIPAISRADSMRQTPSRVRATSPTGCCYSPASTCSRNCCSLARSSGVSSSPKSSASKTGRISTIASMPGAASGMRLTHSIASSSDFDLPDPVAGEQLLGLGERTVDHLASLPRRRHGRPPSWVQAVAGEHHAGFRRAPR